MLLSELKTGEKAVIVKVFGHGAFRKRILEMGFISGNVVESVLNAPLNDPIKYKVLNSEVSLRRKDAGNIEIVSFEEAQSIASGDTPSVQALTEPSAVKDIAPKKAIGL